MNQLFAEVGPLRTHAVPERPMIEKREHLSAEEIAAYIDHKLSLDDTARAESHLADCHECRREVAASAGLVSAAPTTGARRRIGRIAGVAAAAAILLAVLFTRPQRPDVAVERRSGADEASRVHAISPRGGSTVDAESVAFVWRRDDDASYQLTVVDSSGAVVWVTTTGDTTVRLPRTVGLTPGKRYFWYVDALRANGFSVSSGPVEFMTAR